MTNETFLKQTNKQNIQQVESWKFFSSAGSWYYPLDMHFLEVYGNKKPKKVIKSLVLQNTQVT